MHQLLCLFNVLDAGIFTIYLDLQIYECDLYMQHDMIYLLTEYNNINVMIDKNEYLEYTTMYINFIKKII